MDFFKFGKQKAQVESKELPVEKILELESVIDYAKSETSKFAEYGKKIEDQKEMIAGISEQLFNLAEIVRTLKENKIEKIEEKEVEDVCYADLLGVEKANSRIIMLIPAQKVAIPEGKEQETIEKCAKMLIKIDMIEFMSEE